MDRMTDVCILYLRDGPPNALAGQTPAAAETQRGPCTQGSVSREKEPEVSTR